MSEDSMLIENATGLQDFYRNKISELEITIREKEQNLRRLEAQRNDWNTKGFSLCIQIIIINLCLYYKITQLID